MTDEAPQENPVRESALLEPEERGMNDLIVPGILGLVGAALIYNSVTSKKSKSAVKPEASDNEVKFSKSYSAYAVGDDWKETVLEPFLAEKAEEQDLITADYMNNTMEGITMAQLRPLMDNSRKQVLAVFKSTYKVSTSDGSAFISDLPNKSGVQKFNKWLDEQIADFQENY